MAKLFLSFFVMLFSLATLFTFFSCGNSSETENNSVEAKDSIAKSPMQVSSAIKKACPDYYEEFLSPLKNELTSDLYKTINLGMYAVDLGYSNVYDQKQTSINYFVTSLKLADELKILGPADPAKIKVFKENINNKDSITHYTLNSFNNFHENLVINDRKEEAFLILTGSFIEGLYLSANIQAKSKEKNLINLIGEQKLFLENVLDILSNYKDKKEVNELIAQLTDLKIIYDKVEITYIETDLTNKSMQAITVSDDILKQINEKITSIRNNVIVAKK